MNNIEIIITVGFTILGAGISAFGYLYKRNENAKDLKFEVLSDDFKTSYNNQEKILAVVNDMKVQLAKVEVKAYNNYSELNVVKKEQSAHFSNINERLDRQGNLIMQNKEDVAVLKSNQTNCPARIKT